MREITPPYMFLLPGNGPRSSSRVRRPPRAASIAAHEPAGSAPTITTSKPAPAIDDSELREQFVEHRVRVGHNGKSGKLHHRANLIGVYADDVLRSAEPAGVLHGSADSESDVQLRIDDHAGGADLSFVTDPTAIGDDASRADAGPHRSTQGGELIESAHVIEPCSAGDDPFGFGQIDRGRVSRQHLLDDGVSHVGDDHP